jgi:hypothetical protein
VSPARRPIYLFLLLLALFPAIGVVVKVVEHGWQNLAGWEWGLLVAFPVLVWIWLRHFSVLGCSSCDAGLVNRRSDH